MSFILNELSEQILWGLNGNTINGRKFEERSLFGSRDNVKRSLNEIVVKWRAPVLLLFCEHSNAIVEALS